MFTNFVTQNMIEKLTRVFCLAKKVSIIKYYLKITLLEFFFLEEVLNDRLLGIIKYAVLVMPSKSAVLFLDYTEQTIKKTMHN